MIKMTGTIRGRESLIFGLSEDNVMRLREGKAIHIYAQEMNLPFDVMIFWGETEEKLVAMVKPLITKETVVHDARPRKN